MLSVSGFSCIATNKFPDAKAIDRRLLFCNLVIKKCVVVAGKNRRYNDNN
jgi:hypothetical protein